MSRCTAIKASGHRCKGRAMEGSEWCWNHNPDHADERRRNGARGGRRGGRGRPQVELSDIKSQLHDLAEEVLTGKQETGRAAVANQLINTRLRAIELERKIRESDELEVRIEALEHLQEGGNRWGA